MSDYPSHPGDQPEPGEQPGWASQTGGDQPQWGQPLSDAQPQPQQSWPSGAYDSYGPSARHSGKATAALVLGIIGVFTVLCIVPAICAILALIFGILARNEINASGGTVSGGGMAKAGIILGCVGLLEFIALVALTIASN
jgi:hypothetical protein